MSAMSRKRIRRPFDAMLTARMSCSDSNAPETRKREPFIAGLQGAGGADHVLRPQRGDQRGAVDPETRELLGRELDEYLFVLGAEDLDLGDVGDAQQPRANILDVVAELAMREAVRGEAVDDAERIAELVVEAGPDDAGRQGVAHVADALANVIPDVRHLGGRRAPLQVDEYGRDAGARDSCAGSRGSASP